VLATILVIIIGFTVSSGIAACFGAAAFMLGHSFWAVALSALAIQWFLSGLWNVYLNLKFKLLFEEAQAQTRLADAYQNIELACSYCQVKNVTRIALGKENSFDCQGCNQNNSIDIKLTTSRSLKPVIADSALKQIFEKIADEPIVAKQNAVNTDEVETDHDKQDKPK